MNDDKQLRFLETAQKIASMTDSKQRTKAIREFVLELSVKDGKCTPPKCEMCGRIYGHDKWEERYDRETLTTTFKHCCKDTGHE